MDVDSLHRRYAAHYALDSIGKPGQDRINASKVMLVGLGGLGCPAAQYLAGSGAAELHICDFDTVSESNLARQLLYSPGDIGRGKCTAARDSLNRMNPQVSIHVHDIRVDQAFLETAAADLDLLVDASDNYGTRLAINKACLAAGLPWVMGSCIRMEGQVMLFDPRNGTSPCYRCVYGEAPDTLEDCPGAGVFAPVAGMVGTTMAQLALARLAGLEMPQGLNLLDAECMSWRQLGVSKNPHCPDCT